MPKRKAPSSPIDESPSKRVTRSKGLAPSLSLPKSSPRKSRVAKQPTPEDDSSVPDSDDELDLLEEVPTTPSKKQKKLVQIVEPNSSRSRVEPQASPSKKPRFVYGKRGDNSRASPRKVVQLETPSLTPPPPPPAIASPQLCQKRAVLGALQHPPATVPGDNDEHSTNEIAVKQLGDLLDGTVNRGEGNSCLLLGPRGSGKTLAVESCISNLKEAPIVIRLSGWVQTNDRLAMREISRQLSSQVLPSLLPETPADVSPGDDDENPFLDTPTENTESIELSVSPAHMHTLIACIPTLGRPTIIVLDAFDLFAQHPRQSLLYSLLDTVQSLRAGGGNKGLAVIGITTRIDSIVLLEKRVKSRFSGRMIRTSALSRASYWKDIASEAWKSTVDEFLADAKTIRLLEEACSIAGDVRLLTRMLISPVLNLKPTSPWLTAAQLEHSAETQRIRPEFLYLHNYNYPSLCLLIAFYQAEGDGYPALTFEMLHDYVRNAIRVSFSAPVQINGGGIGMTRCSRPVLWAAFEQLVSAQIFVPLSGSSMGVGKDFHKYRCSVHREDVRKSVEKNGNMSLNRFLKRVTS
ncbi:hypothetical protein BT96DRAFT_969555 [Gymnopus androsaceus JB14]|uniref:Uncharacterized protein n=1 Tax=Gymnopus androsaceus JB14 TaxID=1447944 RepID=A0A6A4IE57_9AGAR|nr:hypothetical protein BT96DRAFT_969555 [Gymnopus androsaceus JB14]